MNDALAALLVLITILSATPSSSFIFNNRSSPAVSNVPMPFGFLSPRIPCVSMGARRQAPVRSLLDCVVKCFTDWRFDCLRVNFWKENSTCLFFEKNETFVDSYKDGCYSYRNYGCPHSYSFLQATRNCFKMEIGSFNQADSKDLCNQQHPEGHALALDSVAKHRALSHFADLINASDPRVAYCITAHPVHGVMRVWTSGTILRDPVTLAYSYWWEPFEVRLPFKEGNLLWGPSKPDHYLNGEFCIGLMTSLTLNDDNCVSKMCTICEIDLDALID